MQHEKDTTLDEQKIADTFNNYFTDKVETLKEKIDKNNVEDPLERLKKKLANSKAKFDLKTVSEETISKAFKKIKKKKSSGSDSLTQEQLALGEKELIIPLAKIFNTSLTKGNSVFHSTHINHVLH